MNDSDLRRLIQPDHGLSEDRHDALKEQLMANLLAEQPAADTVTAPVDLNKRRRSKLMVGAAIAVLAVGGAAAASSLFPDDAGVLLPIDDCRTESSIQSLVATMQSNNGNTLQLFVTQETPDAPINGHALVQTSPDGQMLQGSGGCNPPGEADEMGRDLWVGSPSQSGADGVFIWLIGKAPADATKVEVDLSDGDTTSIDLQTDGYFIGELVRPGVELGPEDSAPAVPQPTHIRAFDADGNLLQEAAQ